MDNLIVNLEEKHIKHRFIYNDQVYLLICLQDDPTEKDEFYFAKESYLEDGTIIVRNIEEDEEYSAVKREFQKRMIDVGDDEDGIL